MFRIMLRQVKQYGYIMTCRDPAGQGSNYEKERYFEQ
jgi:hypothetical protein